MAGSSGSKRRFSPNGPLLFSEEWPPASRLVKVRERNERPDNVASVFERSMAEAPNYRVEGWAGQGLVADRRCFSGVFAAMTIWGKAVSRSGNATRIRGSVSQSRENADKIQHVGGEAMKSELVQKDVSWRVQKSSSTSSSSGSSSSGGGSSSSNSSSIIIWSCMY